MHLPRITRTPRTPRPYVLLAGLALAILGSSGCASARAARVGSSGGGGGGAPGSFLRLAPESQVRRMIEVREGLTKPVAYRAALDYLTSKQYEIEARDPTAGFAMTGWQASLQRDGVPDLRYRTRVTLKFLGEEWRQLEVRAEANWRVGSEWEVGVDRALLDEVTTELQSRVGKR